MVIASDKFLFIAGVERLRISADLERGEKIGEHLRITNNPSVIGGLITPGFRGVAGTLEVNSLLAAGAGAYFSRLS